MVHSGWRTCSELTKGQRCFRLFEYVDHEPVERFHEHVPQNRIKLEDAGIFLKTLLLRHSPLGDREVLRTFLNFRGKEPSVIEFCSSQQEYPEAGVRRIYLSSRDLVAWSDEVVAPDEFRKQQTGTKG